MYGNLFVSYTSLYVELCSVVLNGKGRQNYKGRGQQEKECDCVNQTEKKKHSDQTLTKKGKRRKLVAIVGNWDAGIRLRT